MLQSNGGNNLRSDAEFKSKSYWWDLTISNLIKLIDVIADQMFH
jgi:hypothetical protein